MESIRSFVGSVTGAIAHGSIIHSRKPKIIIGDISWQILTSAPKRKKVIISQGSRSRDRTGNPNPRLRKRNNHNYN